MNGYHYERGIALSDPPGGYQFENGVVVVERDRGGPMRFAAGTSVIISWRSEDSYPPASTHGERHVDTYAIEEVGRWVVGSTYRARHARGRESLPYRAEEAAVRHLNVAGVRAEWATPFEDERLGVDLWALLDPFHVWSWVPIDITLQVDLNNTAQWKRNQALRRGVLPIHLEQSLVERDDNAIAPTILRRVWLMYRRFREEEKVTLARHAARQIELRKYGK